MKIKSAVLAVIVAAIFVGGGLGLAARVAAQDADETPAAERGTRRAAFLERVAANLGIDVAELEQAIKDARLQVIEEALASGRIGEDEAANARERVENGQGLGVFRERGEHRDRGHKIRAAIIEQAASSIGISPKELKESLRAGESIADVAAAHDVPLDDVKAATLDAAKTRLDAAVANGRIDQPRADELLAALESRLDDMLANSRPVDATP